MKKICFLFAILLVTLHASAQIFTYTLTGKVLDANTRQPLQSASVFAQNTTFGTATDAAGNFTLHLPNGGYELAVTFTGYETIIKRVSNADASNNSMVVEMKQKQKSLEEVSVKSSNEVKNGWEKYGDLFTENFIGSTANSKQCIIKNKEILKFYFSKKRNRLKVISEGALEIENPALGYKIKYSLDSFIHEFGTQASTFAGYPLFEEMQPADDAQKATWHTKRVAAYNGSILHFMRSVYHRQLKEEGFEVQFIAKNEDAEKVLQLSDFYAALNYTKDDSTQVVDIVPNQPDVAVIYKNEQPEENYNIADAEKKNTFQWSVINIAAAQSIAIEQNGYYYDQNDISISGYWAWEKAGDMVPYDFKKE